ncbi:hypothetical protein DMN91_011991 [Ooceraea biroi]|uniref:Uncharacterized protein n=1 Tax=Ooceraea biroi TaxID=2015173 RepID=A0A3L8D7L3_OOCBI|nr:uncharacterized protein LOC105287084 [Ooceraea biroi]RLU16231.1 hypothetical protein DMN91_011991 [Ooceraea biroi]
MTLGTKTNVHFLRKTRSQSTEATKQIDNSNVSTQTPMWVGFNRFGKHIHWFDGEQFPQFVLDAVAMGSFNLNENTSDTDVESHDEIDSNSENDISDDGSASSDDD